MSDLVRYRTRVEDSARWEGFPFRADDIVISAPPKSGTTWMQTLCGMLVFDGFEFGHPLADISPWLDMQTNNRAEVVASLEAQKLHHVETFWDRRHHPHVYLFHYSDLLADLPGQLRRLANALSIDLTDERIEQFAAAATFDRVRQRADELAPDVGNHIWRSNQDFFHRGYDGQWRGLLDDEGLRRYERRAAKLVTADVAAWAHRLVAPRRS